MLCLIPLFDYLGYADYIPNVKCNSPNYNYFQLRWYLSKTQNTKAFFI